MNQKSISINTTLSNRSVVSVHTKPETSKRLDNLSSITRRSKSYLANEAIERYLTEEEAFIASVRRGIVDAKAGRLLTTDEARTHLRASFDKQTPSA